MYTYAWDSTTGGYLLTKTASKFSKEPRPVYYKELDILGFDKHWIYEKQENVPYMWAESSQYIYRGRVVAKTIGGSLYTPPQLEVYEEGLTLCPVDLNVMVNKNTEVMESLINDTIKNVYSIYLAYKKKIDVFYVAFSGGKDSIVLLDIVQRALPHDEFLVVFGDTDMECEDTYRIRNEIEKFNGYEDIRFYTSKSHLKATDTWNIFGPPAQTIRWCCSVHKTAPQMILLRNLLKNPQFCGMAFTGIRKDESISRSEYDHIGLSIKHKGQYNSHPILEWNSAELYLYIFGKNLIINSAYKKGNSRVGCLVCPMTANKNEYFKEVCYSNSHSPFQSTADFHDIIASNTNKDFNTAEDLRYFMNLGGWKARRSGKELKIHENNCIQELKSNELLITVNKINTDWKIWTKTIGMLVKIDDMTYSIFFEEKLYFFKVQVSGNKLLISLRITTNSERDIRFMSAFKIIFKKSAYCIKCRVCEANCPLGYIHMEDEFFIDTKCISCRKCHEVEYGCLVSNSLRMPKGESKNMKSIDRYFNMGINGEWVKEYVKLKDAFWTSSKNKLGTKMVVILKKFLNDSGVTTNNKSDKLCFILEKIGAENEIAWALMLTNLAYTSQFNWYIKHIKLNQEYISDSIKMMLGDETTDNSKNNIVSAYKNIFITTPLGSGIGLGVCNYIEKNNKIFLNSITRTPWKNPDPKVILYSLFKFAEACGDYYQFSLNRLLNHEIDSDGVSPTLIFGLDRDTMVKLLSGLSVNYPKFMTVGFTHDLDNISLSREKNSTDVLELF